MNIHRNFKNSIHKNALLFIGLFCISGLVYLNEPAHNVITITPRFMPDMDIYHKSNDMDSSDAEGELPNVKFAGMNVKICMHFNSSILTLRIIDEYIEH